MTGDCCPSASANNALYGGLPSPELKSPVTIIVHPLPSVSSCHRISFADSSRACSPLWSKCVFKNRIGGADGCFRSCSFTHVAIRGSELSQLLLPAVCGDSLNQKCPSSSLVKRSFL